MSLLACMSIAACAIDDEVSIVEQAEISAVPVPVPMTTRAIVDREVMKYRAGSFVGLSIIVVRNGSAGTYHYGQAVNGLGVKPNDYTFYAIGSLTKNFTAALMMLTHPEVATRSVLLEDVLPEPTQPFQPPFVLAPPRDQITLADLALYHSNLAWDAPNHETIAYGDYWVDFHYLMATLGDCTQTPCRQPIPYNAGEHQYSNWGYGVLAYVLAYEMGTSISGAFSRKLFAPLNMYSTGYKEELLAPTCLQQGTTCTYRDYGNCSFVAACNNTFSPRAAVAYYDRSDGTLGRASNQGHNEGISAGSGSLWSTPGDMRKWLHFLVDGTGGTPAMRDIITPLQRRRTTEGVSFLGTPNETDDGLPYIYKNGKINSQFRMFMGITADTIAANRVGVIVMSNYYEFPGGHLGEALLDALH